MSGGTGGPEGPPGWVRFADLAAVSEQLAATRSRTAKRDLLAAFLRRVHPGEVLLAVTYLSGSLRQRRPGVGWAGLRDLPAGGATEPVLRLAEVDASFAELADLSGPGSVARRRALLHDLVARATPAERSFLGRLVSGELRQGALEALVVDGLAQAAGAPVADVRRAVMLRGALGPVAEALLREGPAGLAAFRLEVGRPVQPMLAQTATSVTDAFDRLPGEAAVEWKLDGIRIQIHRSGADVAVFTRTLDDITGRVPEVVAAAAALPVRTAVLDGEAIALHPDGRPRPFQQTASRAAQRGQPAGGTALTPFVFDVLHLDGTDLLGAPGSQRHAAGQTVLPLALAVPRLVTGDPAAAEAFAREALDRGHEGVVVKSLAAPYEAGRRGTGWLKVKPVHTLDLVVLAAEWGHGRRRGWLSNLHLGARDPAGGFVMLGKTFKGLTDSLLAWQTDAFRAIAVSDDGWVVRLRPETVVEVAFDGVQASPRYPGGVALRFARVVRYRPDKTAAEADTLDTVLGLHAPGGAATQPEPPRR